jgi:lipoprotein-releasing system ATP-binding protein
MTPLIDVSALVKRYPQGEGQLEVLRGIDLKVSEGERVSVVGPSGAGKSTFLHILGTLDRPTSGRVLVDGEDVFARGDGELARFRNRVVGFVFQFHHLLADFTALENTAMPARIGGMGAGEAEAAARDLLEAVGLGSRLDHRPAQLSGGEQQRVAIARALVCRPRLVLADEPTGNLDHETGRMVHALLLEMNRRFGVTMIVATHNPELARSADRLLTLEDGRIVREEVQ